MVEQHPCVLVVDDEDRNRRLLEAMLAPMHCTMRQARSGREALDLLADGLPDLVLLDIVMPGMSGLEVLRQIKTHDQWKIIPVVMISALREIEDRVQAFDAGADDFLTKPIDAMELKARVRSLLQIKAYNEYMLEHQRELEAAVALRTQELHDTLAKLRVASLDTINCLAAAAEYRDEATGAHVQRMSHYAAAIAEALDLDAPLILYAAPMHDIGKIGVPDRILLKPGKLDAEEWEIMKQHTVIGARILESSQSAFVKLGRIIALTHHERWDGKGYPAGLAGTAIPMEGRVCAVADVFDALTSRRPYRDAFAVEEAFQSIQDGAGSHFDPRVASVFLGMRSRILVLRELHRDRDPPAPPRPGHGAVSANPDPVEEPA